MRNGALLWVAVALAALPLGARAASPPPAGTDAPPAATRGGTLPDLTRVAQTALPAVVGIITAEKGPGTGSGENPSVEGFLEHFRDAPRKGVASGFIIDPSGFVLTNAHVVESATAVEVELGEEGERLPARVVGSDEASDVALLRIEAGRRLPALALGDSDSVEIAQWVMVVGNPFGLAHSVTAGIVSHTGRSDVTPAGREGFFDFIQTDASINPGNSGGPLLNLHGEVVGIATAINATGQGIGFAVPINMAKQILTQLREHGRVVRSWMGVSVREARAASAGPREIVVTDVIDGGPAAGSGLKVGDVITGFEGQRIVSAARLRWLVSTAGVGRRVALDVRRGAEQRSLRIALSEVPGAAAGAVARDRTFPPSARGPGALEP